MEDQEVELMCTECFECCEQVEEDGNTAATVQAAVHVAKYLRLEERVRREFFGVRVSVPVCEWFQ